jgi:hypothetical protein
MIFSCPDGYLTRAEVFEQAFARLTAGCGDERRLDAPTIVTANTDELEAAGAYGTEFTAYGADADKEAHGLADWDADDADRWRVARLLGDATADGRLPPYIRASNGQMERATMDKEVEKEVWRRGFYNFANEIYDPGPDAFWRVSDLEALLAPKSIVVEVGSFQLTPVPGTLVAEPAAVATVVESPSLNEPTIADPRSRDQVLQDYFNAKHDVGERPKQDEARVALTAAGKTWDRKSFRERFNQLARNRGLRVGKGLR